MFDNLFMYLGFALAAYSVIGNDVIQTLGTFLSSNEKRPWYILWAFAGTILFGTLLYGWSNNTPTRIIHIDGYCEIQTDNSSYKGLYLSYKELTKEGACGKVKPPKWFSKPEKYKVDSDTAQAICLNIYTREILDNGVSKYVPKTDTMQAVLVKPAEVQFTHQGKQMTINLPVEEIRDVSYGRLDKYPFPSYFGWWYVLPPLVLLFLTRWGIPVSTTFLILTFFNPKNLGDMAFKSGLGYLVAFGVAILFYGIISASLEKRFLKNKLEGGSERMWTVFQWASTGFLWTQWLIQDFANIYVYIPRQIELTELLITASGMLALLGYIFYSRGGAIQGIVKAKTNTEDIRSATFIDLMFGILLLYFKELNEIPMSTTWVFLGLLAGREYALRARLSKDTSLEGKIGPVASVHLLVLKDLGKALLGLAVSVALVYMIQFISQTGA
ncbi:MAG: hypothetical protein MK212_16330 [Saprospiraceae bacterium]|nr:hypothetical protein [Saprospiraceae bacterium]